MEFKVGDVIQSFCKEGREIFGRIIFVGPRHIIIEDFPTIGDGIQHIFSFEFERLNLKKVDGVGNIKPRWKFENGKILSH